MYMSGIVDTCQQVEGRKAALRLPTQHHAILVFPEQDPWPALRSRREFPWSLSRQGSGATLGHATNCDRAQALPEPRPNDAMLPAPWKMMAPRVREGLAQHHLHTSFHSTSATHLLNTAGTGGSILAAGNRIPSESCQYMGRTSVIMSLNPTAILHAAKTQDIGKDFWSRVFVADL